jgi:hypothetical protein
MSENNPRKYWSLFALETLGASIVVIKGFPLYKILVFNFDQFTQDGTYAIWGAAAVALMQSTHWYINANLKAPVIYKSMFISRMISFVGRLYFIVPGSLFSLIFMKRFQEMDLSAPKLAIMVLVLFSMFCYTRDVEELAKSFT